tara:strand:+ start:808 stop:1173 length:366 start_codon:yes stop_codon:yes gene_type:complete
MSWKKKKRLQGPKRSYSLVRKLNKEGKITEEFEVMLNSLSLEEVIGLKLELASAAVNNKLFGLSLWYGMPFIAREAVFKYALSATRTKTECMNFLGLKQKHYYDIWKNYQVENFFSNEEED